MKNNRTGFLFTALLLIGLSKLTFFFVQNKYDVISVGGTRDADYYDAIALGLLMDSNAWGQFLRLLNGLGLYDRFGVAIAIAFLNVVLVPWFFWKIIADGLRNVTGLVERSAVLFVCLYPTVIYYATDIYRDIPMVVVFLLGILVVKYFLDAKDTALSAKRAALVALLGACLGVLYVLRFYLAASVVIALVACFVFDISRNALIPFVMFLLVFTGVNEMGAFNWMMIDYRLTYATAGSAFGIDFSQGSFWFNFMNSFIKGVYGFYFNSRLSVLMFVTESLPALLATVYVVMNRKCIDKFAGFLVIFFVTYASIWVIGVDSLGTAARYRIFNYLAIMLAACVVHRNKQQLLDGLAGQGE